MSLKGVNSSTIASAFFPIELMPSFYKFLYWVPFLHNVEVRTCDFDHPFSPFPHRFPDTRDLSL